MKNKILIGAGILLTVFIVFLIGICGASGGDKIPTEETINSTFSTVTCEVKDEENVNYDISLLTNDIQFDSAIQKKNYTKVNLNHNTNFATYGVAFLIKSNSEISLNVALMKNDETLKTTTVTIKNGNTVNVDLVLENSVAISSTDNFYISFNNSTNNQFVFDTIITFIDEV